MHARTNASLLDTFDQMTAGPSEPLLSSAMDHISLYLYIRGVTHAAVSGVGDPTERHALVKGFEQPRGHKALFGSSTRAVTRGRSPPSILILPRSPPLGFAGSEPVLFHGFIAVAPFEDSLRALATKTRMGRHVGAW